MFTQYYEDFVRRLEVTDPTARISLQDLWLAFLRDPATPGNVARCARRRDLEAVARNVCTIGLVAGAKWCGGVALPGTPKRTHWYVAGNGSLRLAIDRKRGEEERVECMAGVG